jgi:hypothetical protein
MRILIRYSDATVQAAMLLATIGPRVRAAVPGCDDALEFTRTGELWSAEDGRAAEIEFDVAGDAAEWIAAYNAAAPMDSAGGFEMAYWPVPEPAETGSAYPN